LVVVAIALESSDPIAVAFERAARTALGPDATVVFESVPEDPPDSDSVSRSASADGIVELTLSADRTHAGLHCYLSRQQRWVDREITFGPDGDPGKGEATERGRLLGFAVATMFADEVDEPSPVHRESAETSPARVNSKPAPSDASRPAKPAVRHWGLEFAGTASSGIRGTASGLGATVALRRYWASPVAARAFVAGRAGNIPEAQSTTRTLEFGGGLGVRFSPEASRWLFGVRTDVLLSYFQASHLSEDDLEPDRQSRFLPGCDLLAEGGFRFAGDLSLYVGAGVEAMFGSTAIYTRGQRVALVPPFRAVGELGVRTRF
jgi:hypothetical protein